MHFPLNIPTAIPRVTTEHRKKWHSPDLAGKEAELHQQYMGTMIAGSSLFPQESYCWVGK